MGKLTTLNNLAIFEYPEVENPEFDLQKDGSLFIFGYKMNFAATTVRVVKEFKLNLANYKLVGKFEYASIVIQGNWQHIFESQNIDKNNAVILIKN